MGGRCDDEGWKSAEPFKRLARLLIASLLLVDAKDRMGFGYAGIPRPMIFEYSGLEVERRREGATYGYSTLVLNISPARSACEHPSLQLSPDL